MNPKDLSNEELAVIIEGMIITGIAPSPFEKKCLEEVAERLRREIDNEKFIEFR